jgi:hypothetical protein
MVPSVYFITKEHKTPFGENVIFVSDGSMVAFLVLFVLCAEVIYPPNQWYATWGMHTPGGTRRHLRGYVKSHQLVRTTLINN